MVEKLTFTFSFTYMLFIFSPFLFLFISRISLTKEIEPSLLGGFITASGIFAGILASSAISKRETLEPYNYLMLLANLGLFFLVLNMVFIKHLFLIGQPDILDFALVMVGVNANAFSALVFALDLFHHEVFESVKRELSTTRVKRDA